MANRRSLVGALVGIAVLGVTWYSWIRHDDDLAEPRMRVLDARPVSAGVVPAAIPVSASAAPVAAPTALVETALSRYLRMRDDVNPKPRLALIDDWARQRQPGDDLDLLTQAMVDPDEAVRDRAQELFDRAVTRH